MAKTKKQITESTITQLLAARHSRDLFVPQCKNGASWGNKLRILDAWAMRRSWSPIATIGYEIKTDRTDFEQDQKWTEYLEYVHEFYFVCPAGLIKAHELPAEVGLVWTTLNGERLQTKRRATNRKPDQTKVNNLMLYVLMSRAVVVSDMNEANACKLPETKIDRLREMHEHFELMNAKHELSFYIQGHIRDRYQEMREQVRSAAVIKRDAEMLAERLKKLGIQWDPEEDHWRYFTDVLAEIDLLTQRLPETMLRKLQSVGRQMMELETEIRDLRHAAAISQEIAPSGDGG